MHILIIEDEIPAFEKLRMYIANFLKEDFTYDWARSYLLFFVLHMTLIF